MKHSESIANMAAALVAVHAELDPISKNAINPHLKNKYVTLDKLTEEVRPILTKHGIAVIQGGPEEKRGPVIMHAGNAPDGQELGQKMAEFVTIETMLLHTSGEWISGAYTLPLGAKVTAQDAGAAITYGRRYGLGSILCLTTDSDDDGNNASGRGASNAPKTSAKAPVSRSKPAPVQSDPMDPVVIYNDAFEDMVDEMNVRDTDDEPAARASIKAEWMAVCSGHGHQPHPGKMDSAAVTSLIPRWRVAVFSHRGEAKK